MALTCSPVGKRGVSAINERSPYFLKVVLALTEAGALFPVHRVHAYPEEADDGWCSS